MSSDEEVRGLQEDMESTQLEAVDPLTGETLITPDPENFDIEHHLQNKWTMWYTPPKKNTKSWQTPKELCECTTVEEFWSMYNTVLDSKKPLDVKTLPKGSDLNFFKSSVKPDWDDHKNQGRWVAGFSKASRDITDVWLDAMLASIGEVMRETDAVCGIAIQCRGKANKIALWINSTDEDVCMALGESFQAAVKWEGDLIYESFHVKPPVSFKLASRT